MNVLVACEESQAVCKAFRERGHNAFSCDIQECSGGHPEWHIKGDVLKILEPHSFSAGVPRILFRTQDREPHYINFQWDLIIAHPPCTHLAVSGARHFEKKRADGRQREAIEFFCKFLDIHCPRIAIENPVGIISGEYISRYFPDLCLKHQIPKPPSQIIQPYMFGHPARKTTCLWLKGLPNLEPTKIVEPKFKEYICKSGKIARFSADYGPGDTEAGSRRSKTYPGIAKAMAEQWG